MSCDILNTRLLWGKDTCKHTWTYIYIYISLFILDEYSLDYKWEHILFSLSSTAVRNWEISQYLLSHQIRGLSCEKMQPCFNMSKRGQIRQLWIRVGSWIKTLLFSVIIAFEECNWLLALSGWPRFQLQDSSTQRQAKWGGRVSNSSHVLR